jgi:NAD+ kinase
VARVAVVLKRSSWRRWVDEDRDPRVRRLLAANDDTVRRMRPSHREHVETVEEVRTALEDLGVASSFHDHAATFLVEGRCDLVVTVGGDGTLLAASHGIGPGVPLLGVNSAPSHSVGFFCAARKGEARTAIARALSGRLRRAELSRMRVERNGECLHERVLNEALFCHQSPAATSRYILRLAAGGRAGLGKTVQHEEQKSSGIWVGPAAGSTAAQRSAGGKVLPLSSRDLQFVVREPYQADGHALRVRRGLVKERQVLELKSKMRSARLFLDGDHIVHAITIGDVVTFRRSGEPLTVLGLPRGRSKSA